MPRISWSLAAALSMSALAVFRPEIGSKSLAAHAARSLTRVVESIAQRFQSGGIRVAGEADSQHSRRVDVALVQAEAALSVPGTSDGTPAASRAENVLAKADFTGESALSATQPADIGLRHIGVAPTGHSSAPTAYFAAWQGIAGASTLARQHRRTEFSPQTTERHWKDCAVAAICAGIPGPSTLRSTPLALGKPPSV